MTAHRVDREIERLARSQHGVFSAAQARRVGATPRIIGRRRDIGRWIQLAPKVFALPGNPATWHRQAMAAQLSLRGAALSGLAAAHLHALDGCRPSGVEVTVPRSTNHRSPLARVRQSDRFVATRQGPFLVATVEQTLCDVADRLGPRLGRVVEDAVVRSLTQPEAILARVDALVPHPPRGAGDLAQVATELGALEGVPSSVLEVALYRLLAAARVPQWIPQATPGWWPRADGRVDALVPAWSLVVEADGRTWHARRAAFEEDRRRDHVALANGHRTVRFTHAQLAHEPAYVMSVLQAIGASGREGAVAAPGRIAPGHAA